MPQVTDSEFDRMNTDPRPQRLIEMKLPLVWLLGGVVSVLFSLGGLYVKFDTLSQNLTKLDAKTDIRDDKMQTLLSTSIEIKSQISAQDQRMLRAEGDVKDLRADLNGIRNEVQTLRNGQRWIPK